MNLQSKMKAFSKLVSIEAENYKHETETEMEKRYENECKIYEEKEEAKAKALVMKARTKAEKEMNAKVLHTSVEAKRALMELRSKYVNDIFERVHEMVFAYIKTEGYKLKLIKDISDLADQYKKMPIIIMLCKRDMKYKDEIKKIENVTSVVIGEDNFVGGFKARLGHRNQAINKTYKLKLDELKEGFTGFKI